VPILCQAQKKHKISTDWHKGGTSRSFCAFFAWLCLVAQNWHKSGTTIYALLNGEHKIGTTIAQKGTK
jgi:hypothetical protein